MRDLATIMARAAETLIDSLDEAQRTEATGAFDLADHREWRYLPGPRAGLKIGEMSEEQQRLTFALVDTGASEDGARKAREIVGLDVIARGEKARGQFWVRVLGEPGGDRPWAWRFNGHHVAIHCTIVGDEVTVTPHFFGAEPAMVLHGPQQGQRTLADEEELARTLLATFDDTQRPKAIVRAEAPDDILTRADPVADPALVPSGLAYGEMTGDQRDLVQRLIRLYFDRAPLEIAEASWKRAVGDGLEPVTFGWAGPDTRGAGHYYAIKAPGFLLEYDNTQNDANHIHSVWRDLRYDWGEDPLKAHYGHHHH